jgi:hypothetical protein
MSLMLALLLLHLQPVREMVRTAVLRSRHWKGKVGQRCRSTWSGSGASFVHLRDAGRQMVKHRESTKEAEEIESVRGCETGI